MELNENTGSKYICMECKVYTILKLKDPIRCVNCGVNILYKPRDENSPVQLQAR